MIVSAILLAVSVAQRSTDSALVGLVPFLVKIGVESASKAKGPLLVDIHSFALHLGMAGAEGVDAAAVRKAVNRPFREATSAEAIRCDSSCWIVDDGLYVGLDCLTRTPSGAQALMTAKWTERRPSGRSATGEVQWWVWFDLVDGRWVERNLQVVKET